MEEWKKDIRYSSPLKVKPTFLLRRRRLQKLSLMIFAELNGNTMLRDLIKY